MAFKWNIFNRIWFGLIAGLILPVLFMWIYLAHFYPLDLPFFEILKQLFPSVMLGKILLLSIFPDLIGVFVFYKQDNFKLGIGMMLGALPFLAAAMFLLK
jgi:hypothetical protein